jgi:hypothetical protein
MDNLATNFKSCAREGVRLVEVSVVDNKDM